MQITSVFNQRFVKILHRTKSLFPQSNKNAALMSISFNNIVSISFILNENNSSLVPFMLVQWILKENNSKEFQSMLFCYIGFLFNLKIISSPELT